VIDLVLADDHPIVLSGLENMFRRERDCRVVASCVDGVEALRAIDRHRPSVAVLDLRMPRLHGLGVLRQIRKDGSPTRMVLLAAVMDDDDLLEAVELGVKGIVLKEMAPTLVVQCVREVHAGGQWLEKRTVTQALDKLVRREAGTRELEKVLTARELEIARAVADGLRNKEIADRLGIAEGTVKIHLHAIYEKLNIDGRVALVLRLKEKAVV
jgi:two-component system, NarL family, nitrate/nitrite response regulator NarL